MNSKIVKIKEYIMCNLDNLELISTISLTDSELVTGDYAVARRRLPEFLTAYPRKDNDKITWVWAFDGCRLLETTAGGRRSAESEFKRLGVAYKMQTGYVGAISERTGKSYIAFQTEQDAMAYMMSIVE